MRNEVIRIIADWLADPTNGVNAILPGIPRDVGDPEPPAVVAVKDETRHGIIARGHVPKEESTPFLAVQFTDRWPITGLVQHGVGRDHTNIPVAVSYVVQQAQTEVGTRDAYYTMRAVDVSLKRLFSATGNAARERNNAGMTAAYEIEVVPTFTEVGDAVIVAANLVRVQLVRDAEE